MALLVLYTTLLLLLPFPSHSADPDPLQDFCIADLQGTPSLNGFPCKRATNVTSDDFFFDGFVQEGSTNNSFGSSVTAGNVLAFPGVNTLGISMNRVDLAPGGTNPLHSHPRATESGVIIRGKVLVGFITTGNVFYSKNLTAGEMFVIPRGLMHFQMNVGQEKALLFTAFNSHLPGVVLASINLFGARPSVPDDVLTKAFLVEKKVVNEIRSKFGG
ncbi:hypothetical protein ACS0TY_006951 [Phlomoides rotata]